MRLRRLELVVIAVTLAFACFIGGFLTGRSMGAVSISPVSVQAQPQLPYEQTPSAPPAQKTETETKTQQALTQPPIPPEKNTLEQTPIEQVPQIKDSRININTASRLELTDLPGIGSSLSERIVDYRNTYGPFRTIEDLRNVSGIGERRLDAIRNHITVGD